MHERGTYGTPPKHQASYTQLGADVIPVPSLEGNVPKFTISTERGLLSLLWPALSAGVGTGLGLWVSRKDKEPYKGAAIGGVLGLLLAEITRQTEALENIATHTSISAATGTAQAVALDGIKRYTASLP